MVGIIMGSRSDLPIMQQAIDFLHAHSIPHEVTIVSAHRTPERMVNYAKTAKLAVNEAEIIKYVEKSTFIIDYDYEYTSEIEAFLNANQNVYNIEILEKNYADRVTMKISANAEIEEKLNEMPKLIVIKF